MVSNGILDLNSDYPANNTAAGSGGAIFVIGDSAVLTAENVFIVGNSGTNGGAIATDPSTVGTSINVSDGSTITSNQAGVNGGGLYNYGALSVTDSTISNNNAAAGVGGGIDDEPGATLNLSRDSILNNQAGGNGGGFQDYKVRRLSRTALSWGISASAPVVEP